MQIITLISLAFIVVCLRQSPPCFDLYFCCVFLSLELMCQASALPCCLLCNFSDFWCLALFLPLLWVSHFYSRLFSFNRMLSQRVTQSHPTFISMPIVSSFFFLLLDPHWWELIFFSLSTASYSSLLFCTTFNQNSTIVALQLQMHFGGSWASDCYLQFQGETSCQSQPMYLL